MAHKFNLNHAVTFSRVSEVRRPDAYELQVYAPSTGMAEEEGRGDRIHEAAGQRLHLQRIVSGSYK